MNASNVLRTDLADRRHLVCRTVSGAASAVVLAAALNSCTGLDTFPALIAMTGARAALLAIAGLAIVMAAFGKNRAVAALAVAAVVCTVALDVQISATNQLPPLEAGAARFDVAAANVLYTNTATDALTTTLRGLDTDLLVTVETTTALTQRLTDTYGNPVAVGSGKAAGVYIWTTLPTLRLADITLPNRSLPVVRVEVPGTDRDVTVVGVHLMSPTSGQTRDVWVAEWQALPRQLAAFDGPVLLLGDFNTSVGHHAMRSLLDTFDTAGVDSLFDVYRSTWPAIPAMGWPLAVPLLDLDHIVYRELASGPFDRFSLPGSDHFGVRAELAVADR